MVKIDVFALFNEILSLTIMISRILETRAELRLGTFGEGVYLAQVSCSFQGVSKDGYHKR